ncbi:MAG: efflux RND transporter periplasmic adaptor subunit [Elusimicrobiota bacterium]
MKNRKTLIIVAAVLAVLFIIRAVVVNIKRAVPVQVTTPVLGSITAKVRAAGTITSRKVFKITAPVSGQLQDIPSELNTGSKVSKSAVLAMIKPTEEEISNAEEELKSAEINLKLSQQKLDLTKQLFDMKAVAQQEVVQAEIALMREDSAVQKLRARLTGKNVTVPFDSVIVKMGIKNGEIISAGSELFTIADMKNLISVLNVSESDISKIFVKQQVDIIGSDSESVLKGKVESISMVAQDTGADQERREPPKYVVQVTIVVPERNELRLGGNVWGEVKLETKPNVLSVPMEAILYETTSAIPQPYLYVMRNGTAKKVFVETGINDTKNVEISADLMPNEQIITVGNVNIKDGSRVRLLTQREIEEQIELK